MKVRANPSFQRNMKLIGHSDQGGRPDGTQIMIDRGCAYVAHIFSGGFSVLDVADPRDIKPVCFLAAPPNTWTIHLQAAEDLLLVVHAKDLFAQEEFADERNYYKGATDIHAHQDSSARTWSAGLAVYDIALGGRPRQIGFMPVDGIGLHRVWYTGGRWAYASALMDGFSDYIFIVIDMQDPSRPVEYGRFWLPGMNLAAGEVPHWPLANGRFGLHHPIINGDTAYCAWRDAGMVVLDIADRARPKLVAHRTWCPPFEGGTHNCLPLPDRDLLVVVDECVLDREKELKPIWIFDNRVTSNPISIATCPVPGEADYVAVGGHFGPHNIHENRPGSFVSSELIFCTYQNAGVRAYSIKDQYRPEEVGAIVPAPPVRLVDPRPNRSCVLHSADVFVTREGLIFFTDFNTGLHVAEFNG